MNNRPELPVYRRNAFGSNNGGCVLPCFPDYMNYRLLGFFSDFCHVRVPCGVLDLHDQLRVCLERLVTKVVNVECPEILLSMLVTCCPTFTHSQKNKFYLVAHEYHILRRTGQRCCLD